MNQISADSGIHNRLNPFGYRSNNLTEFAESPRIGVQALRAFATWLGSRDSRVQPPSSKSLGSVAAGAATKFDTDAGEHGFPQSDARPDHRGELG
jgi:hypothetical protein